MQARVCIILILQVWRKSSQLIQYMEEKKNNFSSESLTLSKSKLMGLLPTRLPCLIFVSLNKIQKIKLYSAVKASFINYCKKSLVGATSQSKVRCELFLSCNTFPKDHTTKHNRPFTEKKNFVTVDYNYQNWKSNSIFFHFTKVIAFFFILQKFYLFICLFQ